MPSLKITKASLAALPVPTSGQVLYRDTELRGFGVRVGKTSQTYFVETRVNRKTRRVVINRTDLMSVSDARQAAMEALREMRDGTDLVQSRREREAQQMTMKEAFERYFQARHLAPVTVKGYRRTCDLYLSRWADQPLSGISRAQVQSEHKRIAEAHGAVTANNAMRHLRAVYNFALSASDHLPSNPVDSLKQARLWYRETRRQGVLLPQQMRKWWQATAGEEANGRNFLRLAFLTGLRRGELLRMRWEDVDFIQRSIVVPITKNGDPLALPMTDAAQQVLREQQGSGEQSEWVFPSRSASGHLEEPRQIVARVASRAGVTFTLHDLRRTFVTTAERLNVPHYTIKRLVNHRNSRDVTAGYIVHDLDRLREPASAIANFLLELADS